MFGVGMGRQVHRNVSVSVELGMKADRGGECVFPCRSKQCIQHLTVLLVSGYTGSEETTSHE